MKKIIAILISLLFVASVFGVAQTMAQTPCPACISEEPYYKISKNQVKVGETFTISLTKDAMQNCEITLQDMNVSAITMGIVANGGLPYRIGPVELIGVEYFGAGGNLIYSGLVLPSELPSTIFPHWSELEAEDPAVSWDNVVWVTWTFRAVTPGKLIPKNDSVPCKDIETITVLPKSLPMDWIMKKLGLGKYKN